MVKVNVCNMSLLDQGNHKKEHSTRIMKSVNKKLREMSSNIFI